MLGLQVLGAARLFELFENVPNNGRGREQLPEGVLSRCVPAAQAAGRDLRTDSSTAS